MNVSALASQIKKEPPKKRNRNPKSSLIKDSLVGLSRFIWGYFGYAGLITPWHDDVSSAINFSGTVLDRFVKYLDDEDISLESYSSFVLPIIDYTRFESIGSSISNRGERSWMKKLRKYCTSLDELDYAADLLLKFFQLQVEHFGKAELSKSSIVKHDPNTKKAYYFEGYHRLVDRIRQLNSVDVDPEIWLEEKFLACKKAFPDSVILFRTIVNVNCFDPNLRELQGKTLDPWRVIRNYLGLSSDCLIEDGYIPKGWLPASDDCDELKKVIKIDGDGYYYYADGTQRRGKRHYAGNKYFVIKCTPDNFDIFRSEWFDVRRLSDKPTWDEYIRWGAYPGIWDASGNTIIGRGRPVKWRRN